MKALHQISDKTIDRVWAWIIFPALVLSLSFGLGLIAGSLFAGASATGVIIFLLVWLIVK